MTEPVTYPPLQTLKPIATDAWIVDGPAIKFGFPWPKFDFPTRMTVFRLEGGKLFVHSPVELTEPLRAEIDALGEVAWIIEPNRIHYWWAPEWRAAYPDAEVWLAPEIREHSKGRIDFVARELETSDVYPWDQEISTFAARGGFMTEYEFYHAPSGTLVLTDLIENFEMEKTHNPLMRGLLRLGGVAAPDGQMPRDLRLTFHKHVDELRQMVEKLIALKPERVVIAHGKWFESNGEAELRRAFRWLLD